MSKRKRACVKERPDERWMSADCADLLTNGCDQSIQMRRTEPPQGMSFEIGPETFIGIEFRGIGRQTIDRQPSGEGRQGRACPLRAVGVEAVPKHEDPSGDMPEQVADKTHHLDAGDGTFHQVAVDMRVGRHRRDGRELRPRHPVGEHRGLSTGGPGRAQGGHQREATLVDKDQRGLQGLGFFLIAGQVTLTHRWIAFSSRSRALRMGLWQLHPALRRTRWTWDRCRGTPKWCLIT